MAVYYYFVRMSVYIGALYGIYFLKSVSINSINSKRHLSTLVLDSKLILLSFGCIFWICSALRICSFCLLFCCSNIVVFLLRIFRNSLVGHECFFRYWAMELVSEKCIVSLLNRVVAVKPTYISKFIYNISFLPNSNQGRGIIIVRGFKFIIVYDKYYFFFIRINGGMFLWINVF